MVVTSFLYSRELMCNVFTEWENWLGHEDQGRWKVEDSSRKREWAALGQGGGGGGAVKVREIPDPKGHHPSNELEDANQSHDAVLQIVLLRLTATIPFPVSTWMHPLGMSLYTSPSQPDVLRCWHCVWNNTRILTRLN